MTISPINNPDNSKGLSPYKFSQIVEQLKKLDQSAERSYENCNSMYEPIEGAAGIAWDRCLNILLYSPEHRTEYTTAPKRSELSADELQETIYAIEQEISHLVNHPSSASKDLEPGTYEWDLANLDDSYDSATLSNYQRVLNLLN